jgi:hypothetical protein
VTVVEKLMSAPPVLAGFPCPLRSADLGGAFALPGVPGVLPGVGGRSVAVQDLGFVKYLSQVQREPIADLVICSNTHRIELNSDKLSMRVMSGLNGLRRVLSLTFSLTSAGGLVLCSPSRAREGPGTSAVACLGDDGRSSPPGQKNPQPRPGSGQDLPVEQRVAAERDRLGHDRRDEEGQAGKWLCTFFTPPTRCAAAAASRYCG